MSSLFLPEQQDQRMFDTLKNWQPPWLLAFAVAGRAYVLPEKGKDPINIARREFYIWDLCVHEGILYDCSNNEIRETLTGKVIQKREEEIYSLCSYKGDLYDGSASFIHNTSKNESIIKRLKTWALCVHEGELYDGGATMKVYKTLTDEVIAERSEWVRALTSNGGRLYDSGRYARIADTLGDYTIARTLEYKPPEDSRDLNLCKTVLSMCSHDEQIFTGQGASALIRNISKSDTAYVNNSDKPTNFPLTALESVPMKLVGEYL